MLSVAVVHQVQYFWEVLWPSEHLLEYSVTLALYLLNLYLFLEYSMTLPLCYS